MLVFYGFLIILNQNYAQIFLYLPRKCATPWSNFFLLNVGTLSNLDIGLFVVCSVFFIPQKTPFFVQPLGEVDFIHTCNRTSNKIA